jgi:sugar-specific transcriptional regulator TrmB
MDLEELQKRNLELENEVRELKEKLKKYTAPERSKKFYENHKEQIKQRNKEYAEKVNYYAKISPEKKKQYARTAYLNHKEKVRKAKELDAGAAELVAGYV